MTAVRERLDETVVRRRPGRPAGGQNAPREPLAHQFVYTRKQTARLLGLSVGQVIRIELAGKLNGFSLMPGGRLIVYSAEDIAQLVAERKAAQAVRVTR